MMDEDQFVYYLRVLGVFGGMLVVGLFMAWLDLRYLVSGKHAEATFLKFSPGDKGRHDDEPDYKYARYRFLDEEGRECLGYVRVALGRHFSEGDTLAIEYLPGALMPDRRNTLSRLAGSSSIGGMVTLLTGLLGGIGTMFFMVRANSPQRYEKPRRR